VKDHGGNLVNQTPLTFFEKCWKTTDANQIKRDRKNEQEKQKKVR